MCQIPLTIKNPKRNPNNDSPLLTVPCGKCPLCRKAKINSWFFRLTQQQKHSLSCHFITLTYADENLLYTDTGRTTLCKRDVQLFLKRLRKSLPKHASKISYYAVGEYGSISSRPHYHLIMFNLDTPQLIHDAWGLGHTRTDEITDARIRYTLKYVSKPTKHHPGIQKEFSLMSKGLGKQYLSSAIFNYHHRTPVNSHVTLPGGQTLPLPKYYKEKIFAELARKEVTIYLQARYEALQAAEFAAVKKKNPKMDENSIYNLIELRKNNITFATRTKEIL